MIEVKIVKKNNRYYGFEIKGHAGAGEYGSDVVCAAVSMLAFNTCDTITDILKCNPVLKVDEKNGGDLSLLMKEDEISHDTDLIFKSFEIGIISAVKSYDKYVKLFYS